MAVRGESANSRLVGQPILAAAGFLRPRSREIRNNTYYSILRELGIEIELRRSMEYRALFEPAEEGGFLITFPDFGWGVSQGEAEEDSREMAGALLQTLVQPAVESTAPSGCLRCRQRRPSCTGSLKRQAFAKSTSRSGWAKSIVDRLFDLKHHSRLEQLEAAFRV
jgi:antitoxin HicB